MHNTHPDISGLVVAVSHPGLRTIDGGFICRFVPHRQLTGRFVDNQTMIVFVQHPQVLLEQRLASVSATHPQFAAALRACHTARLRDDHAVAEVTLPDPPWWEGTVPTIAIGVLALAVVGSALVLVTRLRRLRQLQARSHR